MKNITFNVPFIIGNEIEYISEAVKKKQLSGNGFFTKKCHAFFDENYGFNNCLMTNSATAALEMAAILINIEKDDEVIMPSYTFVSTANAFVLRGAKIKFVDSNINNPNMDEDKIESLITRKTKAIVIVHYAGISCNMNKIMKLIRKYNLYLIEDAAQCIDAYYNTGCLGSFGHLSAFSFHETKNIISGEGGLLVVNDRNLFRRAEIVWEKGTNRAEFNRGKTDKYKWVDIGSSYLPSEITAAFLYAQLEKKDLIQSKRMKIWKRYFDKLKVLEDKGFIRLPFIPNFSKHNAHIFYILCENETRFSLMEYLQNNGILAVSHYLPLHLSPYYNDKHDGRKLIFSEYYADNLLRLPLFFELNESDVDYVCSKIYSYYTEGVKFD